MESDCGGFGKYLEAQVVPGCVDLLFWISLCQHTRNLEPYLLISVG